MAEQDKFIKGDIVKIVGLKSKPHWNGKTATIIGKFIPDKKRWPIQINTGDKSKALLKTSNLRRATFDGKKDMIVCGFCREIYHSFPSNTAYYSVQSSIINICNKFYQSLDLGIGDKVLLTSAADAIDGTLKFVMVQDDDNNHDTDSYLDLKDSINSTSLEIGDRVKLKRDRYGVIKYIGPVDFADGVAYGLELDDAYHGGHNGAVSGKRYCEAANGCGYFARAEEIDSDKSVYKLHAINVDNRKDSYSSSIIGKQGTIRYIGRFSSSLYNNDQEAKKRLRARTRRALREIEVLEFKQKNGMVLDTNHIVKMNRKDQLKLTLDALKQGTFNNSENSSIDFSMLADGEEVIGIEL